MKNKFNKIVAWSLLLGTCVEAMPVWALSKDETIYAKLNNNGSVNNVIVTEHLGHASGNTITDKSSLNNIKNVNGNETYKEKNNNIVWETNGNDIYYQGTSDKELPVTLDVKYYLDGKEMSVNDMLGKSGRVKIVINYTNNEKHNVIVNGKSTTLYTPYVVATTSIIPNTNNKNIKVTNGKVVDNGTSSVVVALSTPGMYESLNVSAFKNLDNVEISYDTQVFELSSIYSVATSKLLGEDDLDMFDDINSLYSKINTLTDSSNKLVNGSQELAAGAKKVNAGSSELASGTKDAYNGSKNIRDKVVSSLNSDNSLDEATINYIKTQAATQISSTEYQTLITNLTMQSLKENEEYQKLVAGMQALESKGITNDLVNVCIPEDNTALIPDAYQSTCTSNYRFIAKYYAARQTKVAMEGTAVSTALSTASAVAPIVAESTAKSVAEVASKTTKESLGQLVNGLNELTNGLEKLNEGANALSDGTQSLSEGAQTLASGMNQFNSEGIEKISSLVNGDVKDLQGKVENLVKLSNDARTFDDSTNEQDTSSKIIYVIEAVKKQKEDSHVTQTVVEKKSLWQKIKGLFTK